MPLLVRSTRSSARVVVIRAAFIGLVSLVVFSVWSAPALADGGDHTISPEIAAVLAGAAGGYSIVGALWLVPRSRLRLLSGHDLGAAYQTQFFVRAAFAVLAPLGGLVGAQFSGASWVVIIGIPSATLLLVRDAPTARRLANDDRDLHADGSLLEALFTPPRPDVV